MADRTRLQIADYVKATIEDKDKLEPQWLNETISYSQVKIQQDMMELGIKQFTKQADLTVNGGIAAVPTDMIPQQNAVIDILASTGARAVNACIFDDGQTLTVTALEPGTSPNSAIMTIANSGVIGSPYTPVVTPAVTAGGLKTFTIQIRNANTTIDQLVSIFSTDVFLKNNYTAAKTVGDTGAVSLASAGTFSGTFAGGTGNGFAGAREYSIEESNRLSANTYRTPSATFITYKRVGDAAGAQYIYFLPAAVKYAQMFYYYLLTAMSSDSSTTGLGVFEELLVIDVTARCYEKLKLLETSIVKQSEYQKKADDFKQSYMEYFDKRVQDKQRLLSENPRD